MNQHYVGYLVKNAKMLRHSADPIVRNSVFINADLTKAEALTAYHRRCRRRELATARRSADNDSVSQSQSITVLNTRLTSADGSSTQSVSTGAVTVLQSSVMIILQSLMIVLLQIIIIL